MDNHDGADENLVRSSDISQEGIIVAPQANSDTLPSAPVIEPSGTMLNGACLQEAGSLYPNLSPSVLIDSLDDVPLRITEPDEGRISSGVISPMSEPVIAGPTPPDGGCRAYMVMLASFLCNGIIFGTINTGGMIFSKLKSAYEEKKVENPASYASLTLSLAVGTTFFLSMVAGVLTDRFGIRITTVAGGIIATLGVFLSSLFFEDKIILIFTMGLIFGVGCSLAYTPSLVILGHYFRKRIGVVNGIVTAGSSIFTIALTYILTIVLETHGLKVTFQMLSGLMSVLIVCGFIFKPLLPDAPRNTTHGRVGDVSMRSRCRKFFGQFINFEIWKNKKYVIWTLAIPSALFGYFVPYIHIVEYASQVLGEDVSAEVLIQCIGGTSLVGRIFFGCIADHPRVNKIYLQQVSFFCIGTLTMLLTLANKFWIFIVITLGMGFFDGCFISLLGPIAFDIVGSAGASQAIGCLLCMCSIPLTLGPFIAGVIEDQLHSYTIPFLLAGIPPIMGGFALFLLKLVKEPEPGTAGSPVREMGEKQNNVAPPVPSSPEAMSLLAEGTLGAKKSEAMPEEFLQVDVRRLVNLQRESSV